MNLRRIWLSCFLTMYVAATSSPAQPAKASLQEVIDSKTDLWAETALRLTNGPSLEFFQGLLPPLHYVNTDFRHYPIVLSAPRALHKSRLISNGSGINLRANTRVWDDPGTVIMFRVGTDEMAFGEFPSLLTGPKFAEGYLPIVQLTYHHGIGDYSQETFASVDGAYASNAVSFSRFTFKKTEREGNEKGHMTIRPDSPGPFTVEAGRILNAQGQIILWFDDHWKWLPARHVLETVFSGDTGAEIAVASMPMPASSASPLENDGFAAQREHCVATWKELLGQGMNVEVPEPYVNNAWRTLIIANFSLIHGDAIHYSAGNQYDKLYEQEGSEAALSLLDYGYDAEARKLIVPLLDFTRKGLEFHQAGHKLDDICHFYWQTRDAEFVKSLRPRWQKEIDRLADHRSPTNGLYPREQYCGDIPTPVFSLNSNAKGWRALRDTSALLEALGDQAEATRLNMTATDFRKVIIASVKDHLDPKADPPFIPNALLGEEKPYDVITDSRIGNYWNLMANNILATEVFGQNSELETGMLHYFQQHGGLCMGLVRARPSMPFWVGRANLNPLYGWYYVRTLLRRDEPERALVSFYGMLGAGMTPNTFNCGEACALEPVDQWGRQFYCPPNSAGNAFLLETLRNLLVQDWDLDDNGQPETLRLLFAAPRRWLADGQTIKVERAPTAFGPVSVRVDSKLSQNEVTATVDLPKRNQPKQILLRIRLPDGRQVISAHIGGHEIKVDEQGTVDLSTFSGNIGLKFEVK